MEKISIRDLDIDRIGLSRRSQNALHRANVHTVGKLFDYTEDSLSMIRNLGRTSIQEILETIEKYRRLEVEGLLEEPANKPDSIESIDFDNWIYSSSGKKHIYDWLEKKAVGLQNLDLLSARAFNVLRLNEYYYLHQIVNMDKTDLMKIPRMDSRMAAEIRRVCRQYLRENRDAIQRMITEDQAAANQDPKDFTAFDLLGIRKYHDTILKYVKMNDCELSRLGLSTRARNCLSRRQYERMSDIVFMTRSELLQIPAMGSGTADEVMEKIHAYLSAHEGRLTAACRGEEVGLSEETLPENLFIDDHTLREMILKKYQKLGFRGLSLKEMEEYLELPEQFNEENLKRIIGRLLAEKELEYVDFRCFRVYGKFSEQLELCDSISERSRDILRRRINGDTLEIIGQTMGITRERVRQIIKKDAQKVRSWYQRNTGKSLFDEDYYRYLFETYAFERSDAIQWFGMTMASWRYLEMMDVKRGRQDLPAAIDDHQNLEVGLRLKIKNYLNRNKLFIDGRWVEKRRTDLEEVVIRKYCQNSISFGEFVRLYNQFLEQEEIEFDEHIYITEEVYRTRKSRLPEERFLLWKQGEQLRYYDIDGRDFTELLDVLNLDAYENTEMSTVKLMEGNSEILDRYDIQDQYELHNLLRKIVPEGAYHDFHCNRTPMIRFGEFDRDAAILDILIENAPVSTADLCAILHEEYGYDPGVTAANYLGSFGDYYYHGMYIIDQKSMIPERKQALADELTDNFYYIDVIRKKYINMFPEADPEEINPYNLKTMGFTTLTRYAIRHFESLEAYFEDILTKEDITDISPYRRRFAYVTAFSAKLTELKRKLHVIEFESNQIIHFRKLKESGITREMIGEYCDQVYDFIDDGTYFSSMSLRQSGFETDLYDLGFSDWFYANLLISDDRFSYGTMFGSIILYKGRENITIKSFETYLIRKYGSIDTYDLMTEMTDIYGCRITDHRDLIYKIRDTEIYYDKILDRLYADYGLYNQEVERGEEI